MSSQDHALQLRAFARLLARRREAAAGGCAPPSITLVLAGAVRHDEDALRLQALHSPVGHLALLQYVQPSTPCSPHEPALASQALRQLASRLDLSHATVEGDGVAALLGGGGTEATVRAEGSAEVIFLEVIFAPNLQRSELLLLLGQARARTRPHPLARARTRPHPHQAPLPPADSRPCDAGVGRPAHDVERTLRHLSCRARTRVQRSPELSTSVSTLVASSVRPREPRQQWSGAALSCSGSLWLGAVRAGQLATPSRRPSMTRHERTQADGGGGASSRTRLGRATARHRGAAGG